MLKFLLFSILLIVIFASESVFGQEKEHPIDIYYQACLDSAQNQTTVGMVTCSIRAKEAWDKELNKYYRLLMNCLNVEEKEQLKQAQKSWLVYRDNEFSLITTMYRNLQGTMWRIVSADRQTEVIKQRALDLQQYYETLKKAR